LSVNDGIVVQTVLDPTQQPFLDDHRIEGIPVLPAVMGMEAFAEAARLLAADRDVVAVENASFSAPLKFYRDEPRTITVKVVVTPDGDDLVGHAQLIAERTLVGQEKPQRTLHFAGTVRLARAAPEASRAPPIGSADGAVMDSQQVYRLYFHGPAYRVVSSAWRAGDVAVAAMGEGLPDNHRPARLPLATAPRLVELCFQTAGLLQAGLEDRLALPLGVGSVRRFRDGALGGGLRATARQTAPGRFDCSIIDAEGNVIVRLEDYRTVALPTPIPEAVGAELHAAFRC